MSAIRDISPPADLRPKTRHFDGHEDLYVNMDGVIEVCRQTDTPQAKAIYRAFRKHLADLRSSMHGEKPEKIRQEAMLAAIRDAGWKVSLTPISSGA